MYEYVVYSERDPESKIGQVNVVKLRFIPNLYHSKTIVLLQTVHMYFFRICYIVRVYFALVNEVHGTVDIALLADRISSEVVLYSQLPYQYSYKIRVTIHEDPILQMSSCL